MRPRVFPGTLSSWAPICSALLAPRPRSSRAAARHAGADRHARGEALGERDDVRQEAGVLIDEPLAAAAQAALHLVGDEEPLVLVAELLQAAQVVEARDVDAALALDRLDQHR